MTKEEKENCYLIINTLHKYRIMISAFEENWETKRIKEKR